MDRLSLTQAARALGVPQHRLIHLCEKRVVVPDLADARGRGSSRGFSRRNLFEFAVALELRRLQLPVGTVQAVLQVVRVFEGATQSTLPAFALPDSLVGSQSLQVTVLLIDGQRLYFSIAKKRTHPTILGGVALPKRGQRVRKTGRPRRLSQAEARRLVDTARTVTEVNLTRIAEGLPVP